MSAAGPDELDHVLFPAIARLAAGLLERHAQQQPPADAALPSLSASLPLSRSPRSR